MNVTDSTPQIAIPAGEATLAGLLELPAVAPTGVVVFAHGSGSGRHSPRNAYVAEKLRRRGLATLLLDLRTPGEAQAPDAPIDLGLLCERLGHAVRHVEADPATAGLPVGLFGASTGAAVALRLAASRPGAIRAVVSRGGRPDLVGQAHLVRVWAPTLLIVGEADNEVLELNEAAREFLVQCPSELLIIPGATHLFTEPGRLEAVARLAGDWFVRHFK